MLTHPGWKCDATGQAFVGVTESEEAFARSPRLHQPLRGTQAHSVQQEFHTDERAQHLHRTLHDSPSFCPSSPAVWILDHCVYIAPERRRSLGLDVDLSGFFMDYPWKRDIVLF